MCLISIQYTACGHSGSPFILDKDRCPLWPGPQCVFHFKRSMSYDGLLITPYVCDQCLGQSQQSHDDSGPENLNNETRDPEEEQHTDDDTISTGSTCSPPQEPMLFDSLDSLDSIEAAVLIEAAAAATFPAEKNTAALRVTNASTKASGKSDRGSGSTVHNLVASDRDKEVFGTTSIYERVPGEMAVKPFCFYDEAEQAIHNSIHDYSNLQVDELIELVLSRWNVDKDSGEDV
ncbi:uncharacterized protein PpBr36_06232 [Pyricularia pennisetigena]|uniref:uncharacterized protein n=1 Tax=Pyricularia pennisetigena TaxID=1578925 RepID=UPI00114FC400|nr:uncharacterized protein PpBr36_06232 [Pyricularia pennisetigena]TLS22916.1 hypothetical protein PpBr36_06232 [Pyricularia pennisetigena]